MKNTVVGRALFYRQSKLTKHTFALYSRDRQHFKYCTQRMTNEFWWPVKSIAASLELLLRQKKKYPVCQGQSQTNAPSDMRDHLTSTAGSACWQDVFNKWWIDARSVAFFCTRIRGGIWPGTSIHGSHREMLSSTVGNNYSNPALLWATCGWGQNMVYHGRPGQNGSQWHLMQNMQCQNWRSHRVKVAMTEDCTSLAATFHAWEIAVFKQLQKTAVTQSNKTRHRNYNLKIHRSIPNQFNSNWSKVSRHEAHEHMLKLAARDKQGFTRAIFYDTAALQTASPN